MKIIIDNRERDLYEKCVAYLANFTSNVVLITEVLTIGDILIKTDDDLPIVLIERKSFADLLASIKDGRYEEQSYRLVNSGGFPLHSIFYLLEGMFSQLKNPADKKIIFSSMTSLQVFKGFSVQRTATVNESAEWIILMADKIGREMAKGKMPNHLTNSINIVPQQIVSEPTPNYCTVVKKVKKDNITPENIGEIILCQIPGISSVTAIAIMQKFKNFPTLIDELNKNPNVLENLAYESNGKTRKISKACIESIRRFLLHDYNTSTGGANGPDIVG
jgi:ERCC4-type nuclease